MADVYEALGTSLRTAGFEDWVLVNVPLPRFGLSGHLIHATWPDALIAPLFETLDWQSDPLVARALGTRTAVIGVHPLPDSLPEPTADRHRGLTRRPCVAFPALEVGVFQTLTIAAGAPAEMENLPVLAGVVHALVARLHRVVPERFVRPGGLTPRERQIVAMTARGYTSNEVGAALGIAARTVFAHITAAGEKLRAANKTETVVNAFRYAQIDL